MKRLIIGLPLTLLIFAGCGAAFAKEDSVSTTWLFDVYLDDKKIGYHRYEIVEDEGRANVNSEANFDVKFLFINAFRYRHSNSEQWVDGCLQQIEAWTNTNGKRLAVFGEKTDSGFVVRTDEGSARLPDCVMSFAYWDPKFLEQPRLLNPQTGELLEVDVRQLDSETLEIGDRKIEATPYKLSAKKMQLTVWYSPDQEWLALESVAKGGRIIRYERA